jgi:hypothetical protein
MCLSAGPSQANGEISDGFGGTMDPLNFVSPSLGSDYGGMQWGWRDDLYKHDRIWLTVSGGNASGEGYEMSSLNQVMFGDVRATSSIHGVTLNSLVGLGASGGPLIVGSATAVGNLSNITICMTGACDGDAVEPDTVESDAIEEDVGEETGEGGDSGNPAIIVTSTVDGSDGDTTPEVVVVDTTSQAAASEETSTEEPAGETAETAIVEEAKAADEKLLNFDIVMVPNFGSGIGPADWWFPGLGNWRVAIAPELPLLSRVLAERNQLVIGNVFASAKAEEITTELPATELPATDVAASELLDSKEVAPELPEIALNAVALGNSSTITSDIGGLAIDRQIVIGSVDAAIAMPSGFGAESESDKGSLSGALLAMMSGGGISKADITAVVSADQSDGSLSALNATALANSHTINGNTAIDPNGLVVVDLFQLVYGDTTAKSIMGPADITAQLDFSSVATAIGNMASFSLPKQFD